jgi:hypothetical protein
MKPFTDTLNALRFGTLSEELTKKLHELTAACTETQRSGAITLTLALKPGKGGQVEVFDDIKVKMPKEERGSSIMFATPEGNLQREDPRQKKLDLRQVDTDTGEIRSINTGT